PDSIGNGIEIGVSDEVRHPGVVDEDIETAELAVDAGHHRLHLRIVADGRLVDEYRHAAGFYERRRFFGVCLGFGVIDGDGVTEPGEADGAGTARSRCRTRDQNGFHAKASRVYQAEPMARPARS